MTIGDGLVILGLFIFGSVVFWGWRVVPYMVHADLLKTAMERGFSEEQWTKILAGLR